MNKTISPIPSLSREGGRELRKTIPTARPLAREEGGR
jgi:hypothetical protein